MQGRHVILTKVITVKQFSSQLSCVSLSFLGKFAHFTSVSIEQKCLVLV